MPSEKEKKEEVLNFINTEKKEESMDVTEDNQEQASKSEEERVPEPDENEENQSENVSEDALELKLELLQQQLDEQIALSDHYYQRWRRTLADFENYRRRVKEEKLQLQDLAIGDFIKNLLLILDSFDQALQVAPTGKEARTFFSGLEMICRQLKDVLNKEGLQEIEAVAQTYDPVKHEAIQQVENPDFPAGTVVEQLQKGYFFKDKVLRPALVKVNKAE